MRFASPRSVLLAPLIAAGLLIAGLVQAERTPAAADPLAIADVPATQAPPVPLLWQVRGEHGTLFLLGSFHFLKPSDYPLSGDVDQALARVDDVVFELAPDEMASPMLATQMMQAGLRSDGSRLDDELPAGTVAALGAWVQSNLPTLQAMGMSAQTLQMFEPWFASLILTTTELGRYGLDPALGLDTNLGRQATEAGKPTSGLETAQQQIAFFDGMDRLEQVQMLQEALAQTEDGQAQIELLHGAWRNGDADTLWNEMAVDMRARFPALYARINTERNDAWLPKLEQMLQETGDTLVVVGALHLLGEDGVVDKLAAKGYSVERVCSACDAAPATAKYPTVPFPAVVEPALVPEPSMPETAAP
ncbi:TraB/GumN family protein [Luteimonas sp. BDR2-5]|uniref:TraB/GumN family protein n=1 Tax=Proluteimonas luteida TaxID=2878685 RepID=UPI001E564F72|nr:TraB/GumN family protein [Luteimonas sp. BDR2-5]MCD9029962.1 TraB/GumN family protein [Luteimonas sp. BDR2-5]